MKILYIATALVPSQKASSINVMKSCSALAGLGHEVILIVPAIRSSETEANVDDIFEFYGIGRNFKLVRTFCPQWPGGRHLFSIIALTYAWFLKPDVIYSRYLRAACDACRMGFDTIFEIHSPIKRRNSPKERLLRSLIKAKRLRLLVTISDGLKNHFLDLDLPGLDRRRLVVVPTGAEAPCTSLKPGSLTKSTSGLDIGYTGALERHKGLDLIVDVARKLPDHDFHIVGGTPDRIAEWKLKADLPHLHFYGFIPQSRLREYVKGFDIGLLPNQKNPENPGAHPYTSPLKLFDYMAQGKAILASDHKDFRRVLNENNSVLIDPERPEKWVEVIKSLSKDDIQRMGERAYADFVENYTLASRYRTILGRFQDVVMGGAPSEATGMLP